MASYSCIGLMSGTSLDGLDLCYVRFVSCDREGQSWSYTILEAETVPYNDEWKDKLHEAFNMSGRELMRLTVEYGRYLGIKTKEFIEKHKLRDIDFVASHGHTIFHEPENRFTCQIGDGETMVTYLPCPLVSNFRNKDVAIGGQGAPIVPVGEKLLFTDCQLLLNLGGIANLSAGGLAFDVCTANMVLNHVVQSRVPGLSYDEDGAMARSGAINQKLLDQLNSSPYYSRSPPKSLGREWFEENILPHVDHQDYEVEDILRTCVEHITDQISSACERHAPKVSGALLLVTGGGALNRFLMERLDVKLKHKVPNVVRVQKDRATVEFKEALVLAFLGLRCLLGEHNVDKYVTGGATNSVSGSIHVPTAGHKIKFLNK